MSRWSILAWLFAINVLLVVGDVMAKKAVATPVRDWPSTWIAVGIWIVACLMWIPAIRAPGFTRLIALADAMGLVIVAIGGFLFLGERLTAREGSGVACALCAIWLLK